MEKQKGTRESVPGNEEEGDGLAEVVAHQTNQEGGKVNQVHGKPGVHDDGQDQGHYRL